MKSINGIYWNETKIPDRLILKNKQKFNISYLLSKIFLEKNYTDNEIFNSINKTYHQKISYQNKDFIIAADYVIECLNNNNKILIFGDYDVDGYSSTYLLYDYLSNLKIDCDYFIPDRFNDGYGPNKKLLNKILKKNRYSLVIFVDCGSNSFEEIEYLESKKIKTIIIDHHQIFKYKNYKNTEIINPLKTYNQNNFKYLCATSLVYFFLVYLKNLVSKNIKFDFNKYLFFSAIATICDQMPLRELNKSIVNQGIQFNNLKHFKNFNKLLNTKKKN